MELSRLPTGEFTQFRENSRAAAGSTAGFVRSILKKWLTHGRLREKSTEGFCIL
jgi:hypothetical protein